MTATLRILTMGEEPEVCRRFAGSVEALDCYELPGADLRDVRGLLIGMSCDQVLLERQRDTLDAFVAGGGRVALGGQVTLPFLAGLERMAWLEDYAVKDLEVHRVGDHPVWDGVNASDLTFRRSRRARRAARGGVDPRP